MTQPAHLPPQRAAILLIGNELLSGKVRDVNGIHAIEGFRARGIVVEELRVVRDREEGIAQTLRSLASTYDIVVTSGGVGPTHDDVTMRAVAMAFEVALEESDELASRIRTFYEEDPERMRVWLRMAMLPQGCALIAADGSPWPLYRMRNTFILPGIPEIFRRQFAVLLHALDQAPILRLRTLHLAMGEGELAERLESAQERFPSIEIGSYPLFTPEGMRTRVTLESRDVSLLEEACAWLRDALPSDALLRIDSDNLDLDA